MDRRKERRLGEIRGVFLSESTRRVLKLASENRPGNAAASNRRNGLNAEGRESAGPGESRWAGLSDKLLKHKDSQEQFSPASKRDEWDSLKRLAGTFLSCKSKSNITEFERIERQHVASLFGPGPKRPGEKATAGEDFDHAYSKIKNILNRFSSLEADTSPSNFSRLPHESNKLTSGDLTSPKNDSLKPLPAQLCESNLALQPTLTKVDSSKTAEPNGLIKPKETLSANRLEQLNRVIIDLEQKLIAVLSTLGLRHCDKLILEPLENIKLALSKQAEIDREEKHVMFVALENDNQALKKELAERDRELAERIADLSKQIEVVKEENKKLLLTVNNHRLVTSTSQNQNFSRSYLVTPSGTDGMEENFFDNIIKKLEKDIEVNADKIHQLGIDGASPMVRLVSGGAKDPSFRHRFGGGAYLESQYPNSFSKSGDPSSKIFVSNVRPREVASRKEEGCEEASAQKEVKSSGNQDSNSNNHKNSENAHSLFEDNKKLSSIGKNYSQLAGFKIDQSKISSYEAPFSNSIATKARDLSDILKASVLKASAERGVPKTPSPEMVDSINLFDRLSEESPSTIREVAALLKEREQKILQKTEELNRELELFEGNREQFKLKVLEEVEGQINQKIEEINEIQLGLEQRRQFTEEREAYLTGWEQWLAEQEAALVQQDSGPAQPETPEHQAQPRIFDRINGLQVEVARQESLVEFYKNECEMLRQQLDSKPVSDTEVLLKHQKPMYSVQMSQPISRPLNFITHPEDSDEGQQITPPDTDTSPHEGVYSKTVNTEGTEGSRANATEKEPPARNQPQRSSPLQAIAVSNGPVLGQKQSEDSTVPGSGANVTARFIQAGQDETEQTAQNNPSPQQDLRVHNAEVLFLQESSGVDRQKSFELHSPAFGRPAFSPFDRGMHEQAPHQVEQETSSEAPESSAYHSQADYENFFNTSERQSCADKSYLENSRLPNTSDSQLDRSLYLDAIQCLPLQLQQRVVHQTKNNLNFSGGSFS